MIDPRRDASIYVEAARQPGVYDRRRHRDARARGLRLRRARAGVDRRAGHHGPWRGPRVRPPRGRATARRSRSATCRSRSCTRPATRSSTSPSPRTRRTAAAALHRRSAVCRRRRTPGSRRRGADARARGPAVRVAGPGRCAMDRRVEVHPGHGAGSLCGAGIGKEPSSTIGREADLNPMLRT